jgi:hypothetical protein
MRSGAFAFSAAARTQIRQTQVSAREHQKRLYKLSIWIASAQTLAYTPPEIKP